MKLQTFLAHAGIASRRKAEELIAQGLVQVNGKIATIGLRIDPTSDKITYKGRVIKSAQPHITYLIHKPVGIVSTTQDELGRQTVIDFLKKQLGPKVKLPRLYPVGRLDLDSNGLMILTNDGNLAQRMTHPSFEEEKTYRIRVEGEPSDKAIAHLERGVLLKEGMTSPAKIEVISLEGEESILEITIHEGRYHQVKRMMLRVGYPVIQLTRVRMGKYSLDDLKGKKYQLIEPK